jgi:hypothetical protein
MEISELEEKAHRVLEIMSFVDSGTGDGSIPGQYKTTIKDLALTVLEEKKPLRSKGDFMREVVRMDNRIKEIDSAIPLEIANAMRNIGVPTKMCVTIYWHSGNQEVLDVSAHWAELINNQ